MIPEKPPYSLAMIARYFLKLGIIGFGGSVALVGFMHCDLVEQNEWISKDDYKESDYLFGVQKAQISELEYNTEYSRIGTVMRVLETLGAKLKLSVELEHEELILA